MADQQQAPQGDEKTPVGPAPTPKAPSAFATAAKKYWPYALGLLIIAAAVAELLHK